MKIIHGNRRSWGLAARRRAAAVILLAFAGAAAWAAPQGAKVVQGNVTIANSNNVTTITASNNSIISYTGFNILPAETVCFIQPGPTARVFNDVISPDPSVIAGRLLANGQVYLFNPSGIVFANGCLVNAGAIYAAAAHLSDQDFLGGVNHFTAASGSVVNNGAIAGQAVVLFGNTVLNTGTILAPKGFVVLAAGNDLYLCPNGSEVMVKLTGAAAPPQSASTNAAGTPAPQAGGSLGMGDMYSVLVHNTGTVQAQNITLQSSAAGAVKVEGTLDASNAAPGAVGGTVKVLGGEVDLVGAQINASGDAGGGKVLIGGDLHGQSGTPTAQVTAVDQNSTIKADALTTGNGGEVVVWSDEDSRFYGSISARGGAQSGNGGYVEVSGGFLDFGGTVNTLAPHGAAGTLLLDPTDLQIGTVGDNNINTGGPTDSPSGPSATLSWNTLMNDLSLGNLVVTTTVPPGYDAGQAGDITIVSASPDLSSANTLTLNAAGALNINYAITNTGGGGFNFQAGSGINLAANITTQSGAVHFFNPVTLAASSAVDTTNAGAGTGAAITFDEAINGTAGTETLSLTAGTGNPITLQSVGATTNLGGLTAYSGATQLNGDVNATTVDFKDAVTLAGGGLITIRGDNTGADAASVTFESTVDATTAGVEGLSVNATATTFDGFVGGTTPLSSLTTDGATALNAGYTSSINTVSTTAGQTYGGAVTLGAYDILSDAGPGIRFESTVDSSSFTGEALTLLGNAEFDGALGGVNILQGVGVSGTTLIKTDLINVQNVAVFVGAVTIGDGVSLYISAPNGTYFESTVDATTAGVESLTVNSSLATTIDGAVGGTTALGSLTIDGPTTLSGNVNATTVDFKGALTLAGGALITIEGNNTGADAASVTFENTVDATTPGVEGLTVNSLQTTFDGAVGGTTPLSSLAVDGAVAMDAGAVTTTAGQSYGGAVTLQSDTTLTDSGPGIGFYSTIDGAFSLVVDANAGFGGAVGGVTPLSSLHVTGTTAMDAGTVVTTGDQSYDQQVTLGEDTTLQGGTVQVVTGAPIQVAGGGFSLTLTFGGTTVVDGNLVSGLDNLAVGNSGIAGSATELLNTISTTGEQDYYDPVTLTADTTLTAGTNVFFYTTVDGAYSLAVNATVGLGGAVGSLAPLSSLTVNGTTYMFAGTVATTGGQTYNGPVTLYSDTTLTDSGPGVAFNGTIDSLTASPQVPYALTVNGGTTFGGAVGSTNPLSTLTVNGTTAMNAGSVTTDSGETYNGAVTLFSDTTLNDSGPGVIFDSTVDSVTASPQTPYFLTIYGNATFNAPIGSVNPLSTLGVAGTTEMDAGTVTTTGIQEYVGPVTLSSDTTLTASGADLLFGQTINGPYGLTLDAGAAGDILVTSAVGKTQPLTSLTIVDSDHTVFTGAVTAGTIALLDTAHSITFGGDVKATSLTTTHQPYRIIFDGANNVVVKPVKFLNTGGVLNGWSFFGPLVTAIPSVPPPPDWWYGPTVYLTYFALDEADMQALRDMGIPVRNLRSGEVAGLLRDNLLFMIDAPMKAGPASSDFTVAVPRLPEKQTRDLIAQYRDIFWQDGQNQAVAIRASFEGALADCRKSAAKFAPEDFTRYLLDRRDSDAYRHGADMKSLLSALGEVGLTARDLGAAKEVLLNLVKPADLSTADFGGVIQAL